ncbi:MAG: hypothetical protein ACLQU2_15460 [Candidatus Binataceae bacterium]
MRLRLIQIVLSVLLLGLPAFAHAQNLPVGLLSKARLGVLCFDTVNTNAALDCWLNQHPDVAAAMSYTNASYSGAWPTWPTPIKNRLRFYFNQMVVWYKAGMPPASYPQPFPMPVPEQGPTDPVYGFGISQGMGTQVYLSQVGNSLAAELTAAFSWTITTYTPAELILLLSMNDTMYYMANVANPGYFFQYDGPSPATPGFTVTFFKKNNLIGTDAADTVARLFAWERGLSHFFVVSGDPTVNVFPYFWGPNTPPIPDPRIINGTTYTGPMNFGFAHFTAGCSGTQDFMKSVLRSMNIPVQLHWVSCQHATPMFPTLDLAMTHGDDPYDRLGWVTPFPGFSTPAPSEYFISTSQFNQLFPPAQSWDACTQTVGVQVANIAIKYGSDALMNFYCQDLISGADHASGQVYGYMQWYYPLTTLENMGLWTTLNIKVTALNYCGF